MFKHVFTALVGATFVFVSAADAQDQPSGARTARPALRSEVRELQAALPLSFEENRGQTDPRVRFVARGQGFDLFLTGGAAILSPEHGGVPLTITLVGASKTAEVSGLGQLAGKNNYFIGGDRRNWRAGVPLFRQVRFSRVYPGVDLVYYGKQRELEYDFHVAAGSDPGRIRLRFGGADSVTIDGNGELVLRTAQGVVRQRKPLLYQNIDGVRRPVSGRYAMRGRADVGFDVGAYDKSTPLVIDPVLMYSSYLGGAGADFGTDIAVDAAGMIYVTGWTTSVDFPVLNTIVPPPVPDFFNPRFGSRRQDVFVTKIDPTQSGGAALVYSTYLGGFDNEEARAIAVDAAGNAYIAGWTVSMRHAGLPEDAAFPVTAGAFQLTLKRPLFGVPSDGFIAKLSPQGSTLLYSTYFGGAGSDTIDDIAVDAGGRVFVTGQTDSLRADSSGQSPLPTTTGAFQTEESPLIANGSAAFVASFDPSATGIGSLRYSTYLGGTGGDGGRGIAVNANGEAIVAGTTTSFDFPVAGGFQTVNRGGNSGFVSRISADGTSLLYSTYVGGQMPCPFSGCSTGDLTAIAIDGAGKAYATGRATPGLPSAPDAYQPTPVGGGFAPFVIKLDTEAAGAASVAYITYISAGGFFDGAEAIAVDADGNAYIAGTTSGPFPTTPDAVSQTHGGAGDAFLAKLDPSATTLLYATYLGGAGNEVARGIAIDLNGNIVVAGETESPDFPIVHPTQPVFGGWVRDAFVSVIGRPTFTISGEVLDRTTSAAVPGVTIALSGSRTATATTDANGFYSFSLPTESSYTITPSRTGYTFVPASRTFAAFSGNEFGDFTAVADGAPDPDPDPDPGDEIELPRGSRIKIGDIEVNAGRIVQLSGRPNSGTEVTEDGVYRLSESVNFNLLLFFEGEIEVTLDKALKKLAVNIKSGHIYAADMPPFGKMTLWRGAGIKFDVDGVNKKINELIKVGLERMPLKVAGASVEMKSIELKFGDDPGLEIAGTLSFPSVAGLTPLTATVDSLLISRKLGLRFGGQIKVEKLEVGGGFKVNKVLLKYTPNYTNPARDVFVGEGDLTTPAFRVIGKVKFVGGALDSVGAAIKDLKFAPSITPATPVLTITGGEIGLGGFREPPFFALLSVDLTVGPEALKKVLALKGASIKYTYPSKIEGSTELTLFTVKIARAFLGLDVAKPTIDVQTQVVLFDGTEIFIVTADLSAGRKTLESGESVFYIEGGAKGIVQFPAQMMIDGKPYTGFPFDLLKGLGVTLPMQIASAEVSYRNDEFKAAVSLPIIDTVALSVKNVQKLLPAAQQQQLDAAIAGTRALETDITRIQQDVARARAEIYDGINLESNEALKRAGEASLSVLLSQKSTLDGQIAALKAASMAPQAKIATNFFLLPSEIVLGEQPVAAGPMNVSYTSAPRTTAAAITGTVTVPANAPKLITRLSSAVAAPRYSLIAPDGSVIEPDSGAGTFIANTEAKVSYFVVNNPAPGRWIVSPDPDAQGPFTFDALGANRPPVVDHVSAVATADGVAIAYSAADVDDAATVSLYYDTNRDGFNGHLIAQGLSESVNGTYAWNPALDRVASGEYYIYAIVDDGANAPARRYSEDRITIVDPRAPGTPGNVTAAGGGENSLRVTWAAVPGASGYNLRYSTTAADGQQVTSLADAVTGTEMVLPKLASDALYRVSVQAYTVFEVPDAFSPTGLRTDVAMGVPSAEVTAVTGMAEAPAVRFISPNGGESIPANTTVNIVWDVARGNDLRDQQIELSTDGGASYHPLALRLAPDVRSFEWDVPLVLTSARTRLRVSALDRAGNEGIDASDADFAINGTASAPETRIDTVAPAIAAALSLPANAAGWHRGAVTVALEATDADSGVKAITYSAGGSTVVPLTTAAGGSLAIPLSADGTTTISYLASDNAGNASEVKTIEVKIDGTAPAIDIVSPVHGGLLLLNEAVNARYTCADAGAGVDACAGSLPSGAAIDTTVPGARQFTVTASDAAGNRATASVPYTVSYGVRTLYDEGKAHKSGSTVPIKIQLIDGAGRNLSSPQLVVNAIGVIRVSDKVSDALAAPSDEAAGTDFKFDEAAVGYHFNFKTTGLASGRYVVVFRVGGDSSKYQAPFQVR